MDIVLNSKMVRSYNLTSTAFLNPVRVRDYRFIMKKKQQPTTFLQFHFLQAFCIHTRCAYGGTLTVFVLVYYHLVYKIWNKISNKSDSADDFFKIVLVSLGMQSTVSMNIRGITSHSHRMILSSLLILSLVMCNAFEGTIVGKLMYPIEVQQVNSLDDLLSDNFNLTAFTTLTDIFKPNENSSNVNSIQKKLYERQTVVPLDDLDSLGELLKNPKNAALGENLN